MTCLRLAPAVALGLQVSLAACGGDGTSGNLDAGARSDSGGRDSATIDEMPDVPVVEDADAPLAAEAGSPPADGSSAEAAPATALVMDPASAVFKAAQGQVSAPVVFTVTNTGVAPTEMLGVALRRSFDFRIGSATCNGVALTPGGTCTVVVVYVPSAGSRSAEASLVVDDGASRESATATLHGQVWPLVCPQITGSPDLGNVPPGAVGREVLFTVSNSCSEVAMTVLGVSVTPSADIRISTDTCTSQTIAPGGTCVVGLQLAPAQSSMPAAIAALLTVDTDQGTSSVGVHGSNAVSMPPIMVTPSSLNLGTVAVGQSSTRTVTIVTTGSTATSPLSVSLAGTGVAQLSIIANTCNEPIPPASSCLVTVQYLPIDTTGVVATLTVTDGKSTANVPIVGAGVSVAHDASIDTTPTVDALDPGIGGGMDANSPDADYPLDSFDISFHRNPASDLQSVCIETSLSEPLPGRDSHCLDLRRWESAGKSAGR